MGCHRGRRSSFGGVSAALTSHSHCTRLKAVRAFCHHLACPQRPKSWHQSYARLVAGPGLGYWPWPGRCRCRRWSLLLPSTKQGVHIKWVSTGAGGVAVARSAGWVFAFGIGFGAQRTPRLGTPHDASIAATTSRGIVVNGWVNSNVELGKGWRWCWRPVVGEWVLYCFAYVIPDKVGLLMSD